MTVGELKKILEDVPDEAFVTMVMSTGDDIIADSMDIEDIVYYEFKMEQQNGILCLRAN